MTLRLATEADLPELLRWRNDPVTRFFRPDPRVIEADEHAAWLKRRQASESCVYVFEIRRDGKTSFTYWPAGTLTLDVDGHECELGWIVAPEFRGAGFGKEMVQDGIKLLGARFALWCKMREDNEASYRLARSCGFRFRGMDGRMKVLYLPVLFG
jgi:RimJ/RimL family protein N-acetyltransferase